MGHQYAGGAMGSQGHAGSSRHMPQGHHHHQAADQPSADNSIDISNHSVSMTVMEPTDSFILRGHNCKIEIGAGNTISHLLITGHNNKVYSKGGNSSNQQGVIG